MVQCLSVCLSVQFASTAEGLLLWPFVTLLRPLHISVVDVGLSLNFEVVCELFH